MHTNIQLATLNVTHHLTDPHVGVMKILNDSLYKQYKTVSNGILLNPNSVPGRWL
jgi:hypothetical protein